MRLIESLKWRYATKKFDNSKKVKVEDVEMLKEAIRLAATSYGLQPFKVAIVEDDSTKVDLRKESFDQAQITDCSHLFIFTHLTQVQAGFIENYIELCAQERDIEKEDLQGYSSFMKSTLGSLSEVEIRDWASKQAYIGMTNLLTACADLRIDACPIEGFVTEKYNKILGFDQQSLSACVVVAVGYRAEDDANQHLKKVRLPKEDLFI